MPSIGQTTRPGYVYDSATDTWIPIGIGPHTHASTDLSGVIANSIVDAKADLITATADNTPARLAVGGNGTVLTANSATATGLQWSTVEAMANPVINGGMDVWQRGTSFAISNTNAYTADRWQGRTNGAVTSSFTRQAVSDSTNLPNIQYALRAQRASGQTATPLLIVEQSLESVNSIPFAGKPVTFSFYARRGANFSATSNQIIVNFMWGTGTDQNIGTTGFTNLNYITNTLQSLTTTWTRYSFTGTVNSIATQLAIQLYYTPTGTAGADDWFEVTGFQIDVGTYTTATVPTFRRSGGTISGELAACQRYYWRTPGQGVGLSQRYGAGAADNTTSAYVTVYSPVYMRTNPSSVEYSGLTLFAGGSTIGVTAITLIESSPRSVTLKADVASGLTTNRYYDILTNASGTSYIGVTAEL